LFKVIWGILEGIGIGIGLGLFINWLVFRFLLDKSDNAPEWLTMLQVLIVLAFACLGFIASIVWLDKGENS